jgi:NAD(P)-dependent dehydrogenase (short-subunit alcohol dehydrogenase family)
MATLCLTGATDGIGRGTARVLLEAGQRVLVHERTEQRGRPVMEALSRGLESPG